MRKYFRTYIPDIIMLKLDTTHTICRAARAKCDACMLARSALTLWTASKIALDITRQKCAGESNDEREWFPT